MDVELSSRWEAFVAEQVGAGLFRSEREVVEASLELMEQRQSKLESLRATILASEAEGGEHSAEEVRAAIRARADDLRAKAG